MSNKPESQKQPAEESAGDQPRDPIDTIFDAVDSDGSPAPVQESDTLTTDTIDDTDPPVDRVAILGKDGRWLSGWALRFIVQTVAAYFLSLILGQIWTGLLPILLAIMLCTVLWPPVRWLRNHKIPPSLAVTITLLGCVSAFGGLFAAMAPTVAHQSKGLVDQAIQGVNTLIDWVQGPPLNIDADQFNTIFNEFVAKIQENGALGKVQEQAGNIASGVFAGLSSASSVAVTLGIMLVLTFFFLKDGDRFLPWVRRNTGPTVGLHLSELFTRIWNTLAGFIRAQAIVSFIDALFIGIGLVLMGVPLALVLATITFFAGFVPIVGAVSAGAISVLIALVSNGPTTALMVLILILVVQQLEGNILSPMLQSKAMDLHPVIVLLAVTVGGALFNVVGAFLAVPVAATIATCLRYHSETVALRAGETTVQDLDLATEQTEPAKLTLLLQRMMHRASDKPGKAPGKAEESEG